MAFVQEESARSRLSAQNWLGRYIYSDIHEIFFAEFPIVLHEWLSRLETRRKKFQRREMIEWSAQLVCEFTSVSNPFSRDFVFRVDGIFQGCMNEFAVETITSYSESEINFFQGPRGRYLLSINTWIKMLVYEKDVLQLSS